MAPCAPPDKTLYRRIKAIQSTGRAVHSAFNMRFDLWKTSVRASLFFVTTVLICAWPCIAGQSDSGTVSNSVTFPDLYEASIAELQDGLENGHFTSVDLVKVNRSFAVSSKDTNTTRLCHRRILLASRK